MHRSQCYHNKLARLIATIIMGRSRGVLGILLLASDSYQSIASGEVANVGYL